DCTPCERLKEEAIKSYYQLVPTQKELIVPVETRVPREVVTHEKCTELVPVWKEQKRICTVHHHGCTQKQEITEKVCCMEPQEKIIEHRETVTEIKVDYVPRKVSVLTLVPYAGREKPKPPVCAAPMGCSSLPGCK